jgi:hypothetical protein
MKQPESTTFVITLGGVYEVAPRAVILLGVAMSPLLQLDTVLCKLAVLCLAMC